MAFQMTQKEKQAYHWALNQSFTSVSARYARILAECIQRHQDLFHQLQIIASSARALVERIRELEGDVPDSAILTGAYGPELGRLVEALKEWEEAN